MPGAYEHMYSRYTAREQSVPLSALSPFPLLSLPAGPHYMMKCRRHSHSHTHIRGQKAQGWFHEIGVLKDQYLIKCSTPFSSIRGKSWVLYPKV